LVFNGGDDIPESLADVSPAWPMGEGYAITTDEKIIYNATFIAGDAIRIGYPIIAHEIGHLFGLVDLYYYNWTSITPQDYNNQFIFTGYFDFMSHAPKGQYGDNRDMLGWQRWLLNWISDDHVNCLDGSLPSTTTHLLAPVHISDEADRMIVIKLNDEKALVVELKSKNQYCDLCQGELLTYLVDPSIYSGAGSIKIIAPEDSKLSYFRDAFLGLGKTLTYENIIIEFEAKDKENAIIIVNIS
jgi:hypothetical protein